MAQGQDPSCFQCEAENGWHGEKKTIWEEWENRDYESLTTTGLTVWASFFGVFIVPALFCLIVQQTKVTARISGSNVLVVVSSLDICLDFPALEMHGCCKVLFRMAKLTF